jgi:hypothetical protein
MRTWSAKDAQLAVTAAAQCGMTNVPRSVEDVGGLPQWIVLPRDRSHGVQALELLHRVCGYSSAALRLIQPIDMLSDEPQPMGGTNKGASQLCICTVQRTRDDTANEATRAGRNNKQPLGRTTGQLPIPQSPHLNQRVAGRPWRKQPPQEPLDSHIPINYVTASGTCNGPAQLTLHGGVIWHVHHKILRQYAVRQEPSRQEVGKQRDRVCLQTKGGNQTHVVKQAIKTSESFPHASHCHDRSERIRAQTAISRDSIPIPSCGTSNANMPPSCSTTENGNSQG